MSAPILVPQPVATWDNDLYGKPLLDGYNQNQQWGVQRSEEIWSEPRWRLIASQKPILLTANVRQNQAQWLAFYMWWRDTLFNGNAWFQLDLDNAELTETFHCHLSNYRAAPRPDTVQSFTRIEMDMEALLLDP